MRSQEDDSRTKPTRLPATRSKDSADGSKQGVSRRSFLQASMGLALAAPLYVPARAFGANDRIQIGCIGVGNQGRGNLRRVIGQVVAVAEVDSKRLAEAKATVEKADRSCAAYADYRALLDNKDIDAVVITTPDHWHARMTIDACQAGKHVYCEKPLTLTVTEGRAMVEAARANERIVQTGSQQRSAREFRQAVEAVRSGRIGKVETVLVGIKTPNFEGPPVPDCDPPAELDYDFWLGPAPARSYNPNRVHYNFRFFWDYSGGQLTNWGAHHLDIAQWGLDELGPIEIEGTATYHPEKWYEVPTTYDLTYRYPSGVVVRCGTDQPGGTTFIGSAGTIHVNRGKLKADPPELLQGTREEDIHLPVSNDHFGNWLACIRSGELPVADVEIGHRSATVCHLGNIAVQTGRTLRWNPQTETIEGDAEAAALLRRPYRRPWPQV